MFKQTVVTSDDGLNWIVDSYFPLPPNKTIPDDVTSPPTEYYSRSAPTWNEQYISSQIVLGLSMPF